MGEVISRDNKLRKEERAARKKVLKVQKFSSLKSKTAKTKWIYRLAELFQKYYPHVKCALNYSTPEELLVATILSAQCTDKRVNIVTEKLFKKYKIPEDLARADLQELEKDIHSTGFYRNKAKNIRDCCQVLVDEYEGQVVPDIEKLKSLAGVGRKTANVVMGECFGFTEGIVVDTHVKRLSYRFGLTQSKDPLRIERELMEIVPEEYWIIFSHWLIQHGRGPCQSRKAHCESCFLRQECPSSEARLDSSQNSLELSTKL